MQLLWENIKNSFGKFGLEVEKYKDKFKNQYKRQKQKSGLNIKINIFHKRNLIMKHDYVCGMISNKFII